MTYFSLCATREIFRDYVFELCDFQLPYVTIKHNHEFH